MRDLQEKRESIIEDTISFLQNDKDCESLGSQPPQIFFDKSESPEVCTEGATEVKEVKSSTPSLEL